MLSEPETDADAALGEYDVPDLGDAAVRLTGVSKAYHLYSRPEDRLKQLLFGRYKTFHKEFWALSGIDLTIRKGESVALVGRNGAGKSTLLQVVTSILQPTTGMVEVQGRIAPLLQLGTSFNPEFTGNENIDLSANILGLGGDEIEDVRHKIIQFADIGEFIHQPVRTYSSGMFARLAFAVAAHVRADILIVDEVLSVGDIGFTQKCTRFLREFREQGTLLFVSHDVGAVLSLCDRAVWLDQGRVVEDARPKRIIPHYSAWIANPDKTDARTFVANVREKLIDDPAEDAARETGLLIRADVQKSPSRPAAQPRTHMDFSAFKAGTRDFGEMNGTVAGAWIENSGGERLGAAAGGEVLTLCIECEAKTDLDDIIVGFTFMDRLGVNVFSWDSSKEARLVGFCARAGQKFVTRFKFEFPYLQGGQYTTVFALATGTEVENRKEHWLFDALTVSVIADRVVQGFIGVPMEDASIEII